MRPLLIAALTVYAAAASAAELPDLLCREASVLRVEPKSLTSQKYEGSTLYSIKSGALYLTSTDRPEYLYGKLLQAEPFRFTAGHKIVQFEAGSEFRSAFVVHAYRDEVRISHVSCTRS